MEALPLIGQRNCAGVPVEQANAQLLFEAGNSAADTRRCDAEKASGPRKLPVSTTVTNVTTPLRRRDERFIQIFSAGNFAGQRMTLGHR